MLTVEDLVCFFNQDDDEVVESLLGSMNHAIQQIMLKLYHVYNYEFHSHLYGFNYKMLVERYSDVLCIFCSLVPNVLKCCLFDINCKIFNYGGNKDNQSSKKIS